MCPAGLAEMVQTDYFLAETVRLSIVIDLHCQNHPLANFNFILQQQGTESV